MRGDNSLFISITSKYNKQKFKDAENFCADDGLLAYTRTGWLQGMFDFLMRLFDQVVLRTNIGKTVGMVCKPFCAVVHHLEEAYLQVDVRQGYAILVPPMIVGALTGVQNGKGCGDQWDTHPPWGSLNT